MPACPLCLTLLDSRVCCVLPFRQGLEKPECADGESDPVLRMRSVRADFLPAGLFGFVYAAALLGVAGCGGGGTSTTPPPPQIAVSVSPKAGGLVVQQAISLTATVTNDTPAKGVQWSATAGNFSAAASASGTPVTYTAPTAPGVYTVTATSVSDNTSIANVTFGVTDLTGVFTYLNDNSRSGQNLKEYALTTANVRTASFGKVFSCSVDAAIYAQPLWVAGLSIGGAVHNVVYVATQHDTLYAFDADSSACTNVWGNPVSLLPAGETFVSSSDVACGDLQPDIGIVGTPVIDPASGTLYVVTKTRATNGSGLHQRLHALDIHTGVEKVAPKEIAATVAGTGGGSAGGLVSFDPLLNNQRPALLLENGHVIISWASHCDLGQYHGWVMSYNAATLTQEAVWNATPDGILGGIWISGGGPAADANGNIYVVTGNGDWDGNSNFGDSIVKLGPPAAGIFPVLDYFTPNDQATLEGNDTDLGSGGAMLLPDLSSGLHQHLLVQSGKDGRIFLVDRDSMGKYNAGSNHVVQEVDNALPGGIWGSPTFWNGYVYYGAANDNGNPNSDPLRAFPFDSVQSPGLLSTSPSSQSAKIFGYSGPTSPISSTGTSNGIVWALDNSNWGISTAAVLYAYDATNLNTMLFNSAQAAGSADQGGNAVKFTVPTVANGKVYVGGASTLTVYGLRPN